MSTIQPPTLSMTRPAGSADIALLAALMIEFYAESDYRLPADKAHAAFAALVDRPERGIAFIVEIDGKAAGYAVLTVSYSMEHGGLRGFVDDLFVRPEARRRGLATALLAAIHEEAMGRGLRALVVETSAVDSPGKRLYYRVGFQDRELQLLSQELAPP